MEYLSDIERAKIETFMADKVMVEAVKKVLLSGIYYNGTLKPGEKADPLKNFALALAFDPMIPAQKVGEDLKASAQGISLLEQGFRKLGEVVEAKGGKPTPFNKKNPAI